MAPQPPAGGQGARRGTGRKQQEFRIENSNNRHARSSSNAVALGCVVLSVACAPYSQEGVRPTHKQGPLGFLGVPGRCNTEVVDSIDAYRAELQQSELRIASIRHEVLTDRELVPVATAAALEEAAAAGAAAGGSRTSVSAAAALLQKQLEKQIAGVAQTFGVAEPLKGRLLPLLGRTVEDAPLRPAAFVTFRRPRTAALAAQTLHAHDPYIWCASRAFLRYKAAGSRRCTSLGGVHTHGQHGRASGSTVVSVGAVGCCCGLLSNECTLKDSCTASCTATCHS